MVYTIGETVLDIIFKNIDDVTVKPGGSMLNTAISLGRLGVDVSHISTLSTDKASDMLIDFLNSNGVATEHIYRSRKIKTSLALAYLNEFNNAEYSFYKDDLNLKDALVFPKISSSDVIHFGSFFSINRNVHKQLHEFLLVAQKKHAVIVYDPNFRKPHLPMLQILMPLIESNFKAADIVKASDEDFANIFNVNTGSDAWKIIREFGVKVLFYTKGSEGSEVYCDSGSANIVAPEIKSLSTIGAGDTYSAGVIKCLLGIDFENITNVSLEHWKDCLLVATDFAAETCKSMDNYLSVEFCNQYKNV